MLSTQRAQWRDFDGIKVSKLMRSDIKLRFRPGRDAEGRRLSRKVRMPSPMYRVDTKAVLAEVLLHTSDEPRGTARAALPRRTGARPATATDGGDGKTGFRQAAVNCASSAMTPRGRVLT